MIVYRTHRRQVDPAEEIRTLLARLERHAAGATPHEEAVELLIELGALEAGVIDVLSPEADGDDAVTRVWRRAAAATGVLFHASWRGASEARSRALHAVREAIGALVALRLPARVGVGVPEGYAYYALYPEAYLEAADDLARAERPAGVVCLGLRGIGTSLSAVVEAALTARGVPVASYTLRPRGHPWNRRPVLAPSLRERLVAALDHHFVIVDEGPGISGSSFAGTAEMLSDLGVPDDRIILVPSWRTDGAGLRSDAARERWSRHRQYVVDFAELRARRPGPLHPAVGGRLRDISGGCWRAVLLPDAERWPAVHPQHERVKFFAASPAPMVLRFAGLGRRGRAAAERAARLDEAGFGPPTHGLAGGFLATGFVRGRPLQRGAVDATALAAIGDYLAHLASHHPGDRTVGIEELQEMMLTNVAEGLGDRMRGRLASATAFTAPHVGPAVAIDGRMQGHEWVRAGADLVKLDALDHHDDHFLPGDQDIAWDVAGAAIELGFDDAARRALVEQVATRTRDRSLPLRLPFHALAYLAFRLGYATLAHQTLGDGDDARRFAREAERYGARLRWELEAGPQGTWAS